MQNVKNELSVPTKQKQTTALDFLKGDAFKSQVARALPKFFEPERFVRAALNDFRMNPTLGECSVPSVLGYYLQTAALGLEPAPTLGQVYPVPFNNKKTGQKECQFFLGYRGMLAIARRSGEVLSVDAQIVHERDEFDLTYGLEQALTHKPCLEGDPGEMRGAYCIVRFRNGGAQFAFMSTAEIEAHRNRSKSKDRGPWVTDYEAMALKTVFRKLFKWLPLNIEEASAIAGDGAIYTPAAEDAEEELLEVSFVSEDEQ